MKSKFTLILIFFTLLLTPFRGLPQAGTLDATFSSDGIAVFNPTTHHEVANDMLILEDSSIIICGSAIFTSSFDGFLMHILPDGSQDMSFGTNGMVQIAYGSESYAYALELQPDGKIVVAGSTYPVIPNAEFFIARFLPNGTPDVSFNSTGYLLSAYGSDEEICHAMVMQPDGKFVLAGRTYAGDFSQLLFMRVNVNGTVDASFGTNGYTEINASIQDEEIEALAILSNGQIVGAGYGYQSNPIWGEQVFMAKLNSNGQPVSGFGTNGVMVPPVFNDVSVAYGVIADNDSIYMTGYMYDVSNNIQLCLAKLDPSGNAYTSFGTNGISFISLNPANYGLDLVKTSDNKIYVCGTTGQGGIGDRDFLVARYMPSGILDNSFNSTGYNVTPIQPDWDEANAIGIAPNGKVVLAGMTSGYSTTGNNDIALSRYLNDYIPSGLIADFTATQMTCQGNTVQFTDMSYSTDSVVLTWNWTFEGGTPATSTTQNPTVVYYDEGTYDVQLIVYDGIYTDTLLQEDYITVESVPYQPGIPTGPSELCGGYEGTYTTTPSTYSDSYEWRVVPTSAGTITGTDLTATFVASATWTGSCDIQVRGVGYCGNGPWSEAANCEVHHDPILFQLQGDGGFCEGDPGAELVLDGSETGVDYELYFGGNPTGTILPGTGTSMSFGFYNTVGLYTVTGYTDYCSEEMVGQVYVHQFNQPGQPGMITGPDNTCDNETSVYIIPEIDDAEVYVWTLDPSEAGEMTTVFDTATIAWNEGFSGTANLSVHGENMCGEGPESNTKQISVHLAAHPEISGPQQVCSGYEEDYITEDHPGSVYTWTVTGGIVTAGPGTHQVTIQWGDPGAGSVTVMEETVDGCSTTTDSYSVTIDDCTFTGENSEETAKVFPNPVKGFLNAYFPDVQNGSKLTVSIINAYGQVIETIGINDGNSILRVDLSGHPSGVYFLKLVEEGNPASTVRFVVVK